jgi:hypothetical protein
MSSAPPTATAAASLAAASQCQEPAAAVAAGSNDNTHSLHSSNPSSASPLLTQFVAMPTVQQRYTDAENEFMTGQQELRQAREERDKFKSACTAQSPAIRLPSSLQMKLVKRAKLTPVPGDAAFYRDQTTALQNIETEAAAKIFETLLAAKDKRIAYLLTRASPLSFLSRKSQEHKAFVSAYAADFNSSFDATPSSASASSVSSTFPIAEVVQHFDDHMARRTNELIMLNVQVLQERREAKIKATVEESKAQEKVLAGAHTGESIAMLADRAVKQQVAPLQQQMRQLHQRVQHQRDTQHSAPTGRRRETRPAHTPKTARFDRIAITSSSAASTSTPIGRSRQHSGKRAADVPAEQLQISTEGQNRSVFSRHHPGHAANNSASKPISKNAQGGDRSNHTNRPTNASSNSHRAKGNERERNSKEPHPPPHSRR